MSNIQIVEPEQNQVDIINEKQKRVAEVCGKIVEQTAVKIQNKKYVCVEGWQAIAVAHGCFAGSGEVKEVMRDGKLVGWVAQGYIRKSDGTIISTAEGFCGVNEKQGKAEYAGRAMAQTRAISRVCRSAFAHIVVMINKDLKTTPAEEVPYGAEVLMATAEQINHIKKLAKNPKYISELCKYFGVNSLEELSSEQARGCIENLKIKLQEPRTTNGADPFDGEGNKVSDEQVMAGVR